MDQLDKNYYRIKDVAEMLNVSASTIRYWEKEFPEACPSRTSGNQRYYSPKNIKTLRIIHYLLKVKGLKIEAAREQLRENPENVSIRTEVISNLYNVRNELEMLLKALSKRK